MPTHRLTVIPATQAHAAQLAEHIRPEDAAEMMASHGLLPPEGVQLALKSSSTAKAILDGPKVVAIFGVAPVESAQGVASVWMLAAKRVKRLPVAFMRVCAEEVRLLADVWGALINMIWTENRQAIKWVRSLGFEVFEPVPFGVSGLPFHPVRLSRRA